MTPQYDEPYRYMPPLAGLCSVEQASKPGLSVEECVRRLKRYHYAFKRLHEIFIGRLTSEPAYELKTGFSYHAYLCCEHATALRQRVGEMREPPLGLEVVPDPHLEVFFDEILAAPTTSELLIAIYDISLPALRAAMNDHVKDTNPLADAPSVRVCRFAVLELRDMLTFGMEAIAALAPPERTEETTQWLVLLNDCLSAAGGLAGTLQPTATDVRRIHSAKPYKYDPVPRRDARFPDPYNMGVNAEAFLYDETMPPDAKVLMLLYKRLREIDVPEMMASILHETRGKPWEYYRDMTRQLWDEARHAMMGEVGFLAAGIDWPKFVPVNFNWSLALNTQLAAAERHAVLYFIEQGLMPKTGKRYEWEVATAAHDPLARTFQDYDWADEVLHSRIGRDWYVRDHTSQKVATAFGDACWNKVYVNWRSLRDNGLTQHCNWWPDLYREACRIRGVQPNAHVLSFAQTYETARADLKDIAASG